MLELSAHTGSSRSITFGRMSVLTICLGGDGEALAVFGFEEDAEMFLCLRRTALGERWRVRQTSAGELALVLYGPCSNPKKVVLDPLPGLVGGEGLIGFLSMRRNDSCASCWERSVRACAW